MYRERVLRDARVHVVGNPYRAGLHVEADQLMMDHQRFRLDGADDEHRVGGGIDRGCRGDPQRIDVTAADLGDHVPHRCADVTGPQDPTVMGVERVHGVVLCHRDDATRGRHPPGGTRAVQRVSQTGRSAPGRREACR